MRIVVTKRRKALRLLAGLMALVAVLVAVMPVWFPWALRPLLSSYGLRFEDYDRIDYSRFSLVGVRGAWPSARFEAGRIQAPVPTAWLWQRITRGSRDEPRVTLDDWRLNFVRLPTNRVPTKSTSPNSLFQTLDQIVSADAMLRRGLAVARLNNGVVETRFERIAIPLITWSGGKIEATLRPKSVPETISVTADFGEGSLIELSASLAAYDVALRGRFTRERRAWRWDGIVGWGTNRADLSARVTPSGWWPAEARLIAQQVRVPATLLGIRGYEALDAALALNLVSNRFDLEVSGQALPAASSEGQSMPKVEATLHLHGDPESATVDRLHIQTPWLQAEMTNTVGIGWKGGLLANPALLRLSLDLAGLPGASLTGNVTGGVSVNLKDGRHPVAQFDFASATVRGWGLEADRLEVQGELDWPTLKLDRLAVIFDDGSKFDAEGAADFHRRRITKASWRLGGRLPQKYLTPLRYDRLEASGRLEGAFTNLTHAGEIKVEDLQCRPMKPVTARAEWEGQNFHFDSARIELGAGRSSLSLAGSFHLNALNGPVVSATLDNASFRRNDDVLYTLQRPCGIAFGVGALKATPASWTLSADAFDWRGDRRGFSLTADLAWPARGRVTAIVEQVALNDFADFVQVDLGTVSIARLGLDANWSNSPVRTVMTVAGGLATCDGHAFSVTGGMRGGESLEIDRFRLETDLAPALVVDGSVPVSLIPGHTNGWVVIDREGALALRAELEPVEDLSFDLVAPGKLSISRPRLSAIASGTLESPLASLQAAAASLDWQSPTNVRPRPRLEQVQLEAALAPDLLELRRLTAKIDGQPIRAQGDWRVPPGFWKAPWEKVRASDWSSARGRLQIEDFQVASLARYVPELLAPEGRLNVDLGLKAGGQLDGVLVLTNASTRPLRTLTPLRDIAARVRINGDQAVLEEFQGQIGGQPVRATGRVQFHRRGLAYDLKLQGSNVPLARTLEFLLRGDLDLRLQSRVDSGPVLSGAVTLQDGLYVQHTSALMAGRPERPDLHPPYFSITNEPFANWKLDLTIGGTRFLRVRTPVFNALVSSNLKLGGTFGEPELTGDAQVDSGRIIFPFGTLKVDQAYASLSGNDPRGPELLIHATGRNYRYDVRLEVNGPAEDAQLTLSSTPPLNSEQILLMLTAGELPRDETTFSTQARAGRLATFLGRDIVSRFAGGDLAGERLIINTGENISEEGKTTYSIEYRLTDRWSIIGEYDRFSALNAGVKWKVYSR